MAPETQRDAQAVASEFVIRVERDDQRAPRAVDVQAAVGSTDCLAPVSIRQERDPLLRALLLAAQPHPAEQGLSQEAVVHHIGWRGWQTGDALVKPRAAAKHGTLVKSGSAAKWGESVEPVEAT